MRQFLWILLISSCFPQNLPDSPSSIQNPEVKTCGPKWAGGCWDYHAARRSNWEVVKDPYFFGPTLADALVTSFDGAVTAYGVNNSPCAEANHDLGPHPSNLRIAEVNGLIFGVTTGFRFLAMKAVPKDNHSRLVWIPRVFSIGTAARSAQVHIHGAMTWFRSGCL